MQLRKLSADGDLCKKGDISCVVYFTIPINLLERCISWGRCTGLFVTQMAVTCGETGFRDIGSDYLSFVFQGS